MRIEGLFSGQNIDISNILSTLNIGDIIRAKVLEFTSNELLLRLFDGTTIKASTMSSIDVKQGEFVNFIVSNKSDNQVVLETVKSNDNKTSQSDKQLVKQLVAMDVKPDTSNVEIAKEIKSNSLPLNKETFDKILDFAVKFKDLSPAKAAFLMSNNISIEEKNISNLNHLIEGKLKIGSGVNELSKLLSQVEDSQVISNIEKGFLDIKADKTAFLENTNNQTGTTNSDTIRSNTIGSNTINSMLISGDHKELNTLLNKLNLQEELEKFIIANKGNFTNIPERVDSFIKSNAAIFEKMPPSVTRNLHDLLTQLLSNKQIAATSQSEAFAHENKDNANNFLKKALEDIFIKIDSHSLKEDVKELYKETYLKLEIIKENVSSSTIPLRDEVIRTIESLQNNIRFLNDVNSHNTYMQIPFSINNKNITSELYVLKRNPRRKKIDPDNVTMLLSLDTENLGRVDSLISLNNKNISLSMRVENQDIERLFKENHKNLYKSLAEKGYKLVDLKLRPIGEHANILNVKEIAKSEEQSNNTSIDYRL